MPHDVLMSVSRNERRRLLDAEARACKTGEWGDWERLTFPRGSAGKRWAAEFTTVYRNRVFSVLVRDAGTAVHMAVSSLSQIRPTWHEMQRIKDELAGEDATAVEVYPPRREVVDDADMFHLWVLPAPLPFTIYEQQ